MGVVFQGEVLVEAFKKRIIQFKGIIKIGRQQVKKDWLSWKLIFPIMATITFVVWFLVDKRSIPIIWLIPAGFGMGYMYARYLMEYFFGDYFDGKRAGYESGFNNAEKIYQQMVEYDLIASNLQKKIRQQPGMRKTKIDVLKPKRIVN